VVRDAHGKILTARILARIAVGAFSGSVAGVAGVLTGKTLTFIKPRAACRCRVTKACYQGVAAVAAWAKP
jgi:hypothetical protein